MDAAEFWALMARFNIRSWVELVWASVGLGGQALFFMRFFIQWIASERKKESVIPLAFWYFSIGGGAVLLAYACYKADLVFILGQGGGLVIYHAANNAFPQWEAWNKMIGLGWRDNKFGDRITVDDSGKIVRTPKGEGPGAGHGPQWPYEVKVFDKSSPIMAGMPEKWTHAADELYQGQRGPAQDMTILATAFAPKTKGGNDANEPMVWTIPFGKGRVFVNLLGHDEKSVAHPGCKALMLRGTEWAATGKVTIPVPADVGAAK
jgi:lipid-A-disaccharide synthase-like uncharacterized protein